MSDYSSERYDPQIPYCKLLAIYFDGFHLRMLGGTKAYSYAAVSGKPVGGNFDYSTARQRVSNEGPIPEGNYWVRPDQLADKSWNCYFSQKFCDAWGKYRLTIHPFTTTETYGRGGFFIHGGSVPGSAGCIDLTTEIDRFVEDLKRELGTDTACQIRVNINYSTPGDFPLPWGPGRMA